MKFLNTVRLIHFLNKLKSIFGSKKVLDVNMKYRMRYLLNVDYADIAFDTKWLVSDTRARVGYARVDKTRI
jgi:hypothetical protein